MGDYLLQEGDQVVFYAGLSGEYESVQMESKRPAKLSILGV